jgi:hypothetical protein
MENYVFTPSVDGYYLITGAYGYGVPSWCLSPTSYYKLCDCQTSIYEWFPDYFVCDHGYDYISGQSTALTYDSAGTIIDLSSNTIIDYSDDGGYGCYYREDFQIPTIEDFGIECPNHGKYFSKYETCSTCKKTRYYYDYCLIGDDGGLAEYNFGFYTQLTAGKQYATYILPLVDTYDAVYDDFILIRYQGPYEE